MSERGRRGEGAARFLVAYLLAGLLAASLNAVFIALLPIARPLGEWTDHFAIDLGHQVSLALLLGALSASWGKAWRVVSTKAERRGRALLLVVSWGLSAGLFGLLLNDDFSGFVNRQGDEGSSLPWFAILISMTATVFVGAQAAVWSVRARWWRWLCGSAGVVLLVGNQFAVPDNYPGAHLMAVVGGLSCLARALLDVGNKKIRRFLSRPGGMVFAFAATVGCVVSLVYVPAPSVWQDLYRVPGSVVPQYLAQFRGQSRAGFLVDSEWFRDRSKSPAIPPQDKGALPENPIVLFVTIDAMRADLLLEGKHEKFFPHLARLSRRSLHFTHARSPSPSTATTFSAIYKGKYYSATRWTGKGDSAKRGKGLFPRKDKSPTVAQLLRKKNVVSVNMRTINMFSNGSGIGRGFRETIKVGHYSSARAGVTKLITRLRKHKNKGREKPLFAAIHLIDPHAPYTMGRARRFQEPFEKWLAEIEYVDQQIGRLLKAIESLPTRDRVLLFVASDHGEAFGEHGSHFHAKTMYEELLRVPLLVYGAKIEPRRVDAPVSLIDLGPTFLDLFEVNTPGDFMGQSLTPFLRGDSREFTRPLAGEAGRRMQSLILPNGLKAIVDLKKQTEAVYDLNADPKELNNLAGKGPRAEEALNHLRAFFQAHQLPNYSPPWREF